MPTQQLIVAIVNGEKTRVLALHFTLPPANPCAPFQRFHEAYDYFRAALGERPQFIVLSPATLAILGLVDQMVLYWDPAWMAQIKQETDPISAHKPMTVSAALANYLSLRVAIDDAAPPGLITFSRHCPRKRELLELVMDVA